MQHNQIENKEPKVCQAKRYDNSPCGRDSFAESPCIFHSEDIANKKARFEKEFWNEYERQKNAGDEIFDFSRFIFPDSISFEKKEFEKNTYFIEAKFFGEITNFKETKFLGDFTNFGGAKFKAQATSFERAEFLGNEIHFGINEFGVMAPAYFTETIKLSGCEFLSERNTFSYAKFESKFINFKGTKFSGANVSFFGTEFIGNVEFCGCSDYIDGPYDGANFQGHAIFCKAKFEGEKADFSLSKFASTDFSAVEFLSKNTYFSKVVFSNRVDFGSYSYTMDWESEAAKFSGENVNFSGAQFLGDTNFSDVEFSSKNVNFSGAKFRSIGGLFEAISYKKKLFKRKYKIKDFRFNLEEESAINYPLIKRMTQDAWYLADFKRNYPKMFALWKLTSNCGRSFFRWGMLSLGIIILFAILFLIFGQSAFELRHNTWFTFFYYSIVTFTTLGFGDITPIKWYTEIFVTIEVILGYIMLGGLISIFANKLARRS